MTEAVAVVLIVMVLPFVVMLAMKLGTYGFYQGRELYLREKKDGENEERTKTSLRP
jgi:hypothetical protein